MLPLCNYFIASWFWHFDIRVHDASYMDDVVWICCREHVVALSSVSWGWEKDWGNARTFLWDKSPIIWKNTWGYLSTSRMESWNKIGLEIGDICIFSHLGVGGLLGVSSFRKATPEAGAGGSQRCVDTLVRFPNLENLGTWLVDTRYRDVNIAAHQLLEGIKRWVLCSWLCVFVFVYLTLRISRVFRFCQKVLCNCYFG